MCNSCASPTSRNYYTTIFSRSHSPVSVSDPVCSISTSPSIYPYFNLALPLAQPGRTREVCAIPHTPAAVGRQKVTLKVQLGSGCAEGPKP